ncbi:MAG: flagellar hook-length control protein FliK [Planctomycetes bacterium]|nr:flagellar hook-length control protein FliK [Planctomycetota bacterium]
MTKLAPLSEATAPSTSASGASSHPLEAAVNSLTAGAAGDHEALQLAPAPAPAALEASTVRAAAAIVETRAAEAPVRMPPAAVPAFLDELAVRVDAAERTAVVELDPPELGRLRVELTIDGEGALFAVVRAERADGYLALEARLSEMRSALSERGFAGADVQLFLGLAQRDARRDPRPGSARNGLNEARELSAVDPSSLIPTRAGSIDLWA